MKWILNIFFIGLMLSITPFSHAADESVNENYVSVNPLANVSDLEAIRNSSLCAAVTYDGVDMVHPQDFSICPNDISYSILGMVFQKIFLENEVLGSFQKGDNNNEDMAYAYNIGGPIIAIIESVTWLTFLLSSLTLTYVVIKTLNISAGSGQFMGNWNSVFVMTRTLGAMVLIVPIGSFSLAQVAVLIMAMLGIMGGNYIWGAFLSMQQAGTVILEENETSFEILALSQAESLVKTNMCSIRSASASTEANQKNIAEQWFDVDVDTHLSRLASCSRNNMFVAVDQSFTSTANQVLGPNGLPSTEPSAFPLSTISFGSPTYCNGVFDFSNKYVEERYGKNYQCGNVSFSTADLEYFTDNNAEVEDESFWQTSTKKDIIDTVDTFNNNYDYKTEYDSIRNKGYQISKNGTGFKEDNYEADVERLTTLLVSTGQEIFQDIKDNIDSTSSNPPAAYEGTFIAISAIHNNLMGGRYDSRNYATFWEKFKSIDFEYNENGVGFSVNKAVQIYSEDEVSLGLHPMYTDAKRASLYAISAHCATIWPTYVSKYETSEDYFQKMSASWRNNSDFKDQTGSFSANCITPLYNSSLSYDKALISDDLVKALPNVTDDNANKYYLVLAETENEARFNLLHIRDDAVEERGARMEEAISQIVSHSLEESKAIIAGMTAYNYVVREASKRALVKIFQEKTDTTFLLRMRDLGWAGAGGFILSLSNEGGDLNKYSRIIQDQVTFGDANSNELFVNKSVIEHSDVFQFNSMSATANKILTDSFVTGEYEDVNERDAYQISMSDVVSFIEDMFTAPMSHLKTVGGFDQNKTLREGAKDCYENSSCTITDVHPVTALMNMGNELIELCFTIVILKTITGLIVLAATGDDGTGEMQSKNKKGGVMKLLTKSLGGLIMNTPIGRVILVIASILDPLLGMLMKTVVPPLFVVGIFFSFVIPMMPFLAFLMGFIGWLMLILELLIAVNVWVLMMATPDQNGTSRADPRAIINFAGQLVLKPGLMVVALIFGWYLSAISVYFLNMTIFGALSPTKTGSILGLLDLFMFYIVYLIMIFVAIKHSFKIIEILPDKIFSLINIARSGDVKSDSLGMERLVQLAAGEKVLSLASQPAELIDQKKDEAKFKLEKEKEETAAQKRKESVRDLREEAEAKKELEESLKERNDPSSKKLDDANPVDAPEAPPEAPPETPPSGNKDPKK